MNEKKILNILKEALEIENLNIDDSSDTIEEWDSLGQLSILSALDKETKGKVSSIKGLSDMFTVKEIIKSLKSI